MKAVKPMREIIAEAIRGNPLHGEPAWADLSEVRRKDWLEDAARVMSVLRNEMWYHFAEFSFHMGGVDWLAIDPDDLWKEFFDECINQNGPIWPRDN